MINIRTITYNLPECFNNNDFNIIEKCINEWKKNEYFIRTTRINTASTNDFNSIKRFEMLNTFCDKQGIRWFNIPLEINDNNKQALIPFCCTILKAFDKAFINFDGVKNSTISIDAIEKYTELALQISKISLNGKDNFRVGLSINKIANAPFFPFTKSAGNLGFSIGLELTQEINKIVSSNKDINFETLRNIIINTIDPQITQIEKFALKIEETLGIPFFGFDFSLAPIIEDNGSILEMISKLGINDFAGPGLMFITSYLTNILKSFGNTHRHLGFSGVMYSLVEDTKFSEINNIHPLRLEDIIKLSTMCGCGIDMVPIDITTPKETLTSYILDIAAISCRLKKPLGVRFLPIATAFTKFDEDADFITNTRSVALSDNTLLFGNMKRFNYIDLCKT